VDDTAADSDFYNDRMEKTDTYNFLYDKALPASLNEIEEDAEPEDIPVYLTKVQDETIDAMRNILPPQWLQDQFEAATHAFLPYFLGETDEFTYTFVLKERAEDAGRVLRDDFLQGETFQSVYDDGMQFLAEKLVENLDHLPYEVHLTTEQIKNAITTTIPPEWVIRQVSPSIDSALPYFTGDTDHFDISILVADLVDTAASQLLTLFSNEATYRYLMDELIVPTVEENLGTRVELPFNVTLLVNDIASAIEDALSQEWIEQRLEEVVRGFAAYVKGEAQTFAVAIDLGDRKTSAIPTLSQIVKDRIGPSYVQKETELGMSVEEAIQRYILNEIPDQWTYTEADLRETMGPDNQGILDDARKWVQSGWTYTEIDLQNDLGPSRQDDLEDIRDWIANGYTLTEQDLRDEMDEDELKDFDNARDQIDSARSWLWVIWILPFLLLVGIGFLAGRGWNGRVYWAFGTLFITALVIHITLSAVYANVGKDEIKDAFELSEKEGLELVLMEQGQTVALDAADTFVCGIKNDLLWMMIISGLILTVVIARDVRDSRRREREETIESDFSPFNVDDQ